MLDNRLKQFLANNFTKTYKDYLINKVYGDKKIFDEQFKSKKIQKAFYDVVKEYFNTLYAYYEQYPDGNFDNQLKFIKNNQTLQNYVKKYIEVSQGDETLYGFLQVYGYCVEQVNDMSLNDNGDFSVNLSRHMFDLVAQTSGKMYGFVKLDIDANNYWWLKDTATTLRRQLSEKLIIINNDRLQYMFDKYFPRKFDVNNIRKVDNVELMKDLDFAMYRKYHTLPYYFWWGENDKGERKLKMSPEPPQNGNYTFVVYQNYTSNEVEKKEYYL